MKKLLLSLLVSGTVVSVTASELIGVNPDILRGGISVELPVKDAVMALPPEEVLSLNKVDDIKKDDSTKKQNLKDFVKEGVTMALADSKKELTEEFNKFTVNAKKQFEQQRKEMIEQILAMVVLFLKEKLPGMVMDSVKSVVSSPKGALNKVKGWFGYGDTKVAPQPESAAVVSKDVNVERLINNN